MLSLIKEVSDFFGLDIKRDHIFLPVLSHNFQQEMGFIKPVGKYRQIVLEASSLCGNSPNCQVTARKWRTGTKYWVDSQPSFLKTLRFWPQVEQLKRAQ